MLSCPVGRAEDEEAAPLDASTALSMSDRIVVSSPIGGRLIAELSMSGFAGLFASLQHVNTPSMMPNPAKACIILVPRQVGRQTSLASRVCVFTRLTGHGKQVQWFMMHDKQGCEVTSDAWIRNIFVYIPWIVCSSPGSWCH